MFIDESTARNAVAKTNPYYAEATAEPSWMMEALMESQEQYHNLCMKMVKLEHTAIVSENTSMLDEGMKEFGAKAAEIGKNILAKFLAFIQRVQEAWTKMYSEVLVKLLGNVSRFKNAKFENNFKIEVKVKNFDKAYDSFMMLAQEGRWGNPDFYNSQNIAQFRDELEAISGAVKGKENAKTEISGAMVKNYFDRAVQFLEKRKTMINALNGLRNAGKKLYKGQMKNQTTKDGKAESKNELHTYMTLCSKCVNIVNYATVDAVKIIRAVQAQNKSAFSDSADKFKQKAKADKAQAKADEAQAKANKAKQESASILDLF